MKRKHPGSSLGSLFMNGRSQAVRLPRAFRLPGSQVRVSRVEHGVLLTPVFDDVNAWFAEMDRLDGAGFFTDERTQPPMPDRPDLFE